MDNPDTINQDTLVKKLDSVNSGIDEAKQKKDEIQKQLAKASNDQKALDVRFQKDKATTENADSIFKYIELLGDLPKKIEELKTKELSLYTLTEKTLDTLKIAIENSNMLTEHINQVKSSKKVLFSEIEKDNSATYALLMKASEDTILAYKNTLTALKSIESLEQYLVKIQEQLDKLKGTSGTLKTYFENILEKCVGEMKNLEKTAKDFTNDSEKAEKKLNKLQTELKTLKETKAVLDSIGV